MRKTSGGSACSLNYRPAWAGPTGRGEREQGARRAQEGRDGRRSIPRRSRRSWPARTATPSPCSACRARGRSSSPAPSSTAPPSSRPSPSTASPRARSSAATTPASSRARSRIRKRQPLKYRARNAGGEWWVTDAYSFGPVLGPMDDYYIREGSHLRLFDKMGAHPLHHEGADGVHFAVWAPNARRVSVVGDFNAWDGRRHTMRLRRDTGIWEIFIPDVRPGLAYKYEIIAPDGARLPLKADPFARASELRPATASIVAPELEHDWGDAAHRAYWGEADARRTPISIYEVHAGSWQRDGERLPLLGRARPTGSSPTSPTWASPTSSSCRSPSTPTTRRGATRPPASTRRPPASARPRASPASSTARTAPASASSSTGCRRTSPPTRTASPASTAPRSTSTPTRARASTPTGTPRSSTSAARRSSPSCSTTRSTGRRSSTSTACASTPSPPCSTSTTPAARASGSPTSTAAARTSRPSPSCRR